MPSLQGFLHWLANGAVEVKRELDEGARDKVRIMTVHGAKGLQAPIVILPDTTQLPQARPNLLWLRGRRWRRGRRPAALVAAHKPG